MTNIARPKLLCRILGHKWDILGITGKHKWCSRCRSRNDAS